jgi:hypothetical protein
MNFIVDVSLKRAFLFWCQALFHFVVMGEFKSAWLVSFLLFFVLSFVCAEEWDDNNDPRLFSIRYTYRLSMLPVTSRTPVQPWSDTYWPSYQSGIAHRWNAPNPQDFSYRLNTRDQLQKMSQAQLRQLSPAEKYDIYMRRYDYPLVRSEWKRTDPRDKMWEGLCHGWAPASITYAEPKPITVSNGDGITIPFGSSDIKALLTYFAAEYAQGETKFVADRCNYDLDANPDKENVSECADINAGTFHVILANQLAKGPNQLAFVGDIDRGIQVWNQPIFSFQSQQIDSRPPSNGSAPGTVKEVKLSTTMYYTKEYTPNWNGGNPVTRYFKYEYWLELDRNGNIIGGSHETWDRLDFAWSTKLQPFRDYFAALQILYTLSTNRTVVPSVLAPLRDVTTRPNYAVVRGNKGTITLSKTPYPNNYEQSWSIVPDDENTRQITISFKDFATERYRDKLKIYEGAKGEGALVAVLHGTQLPEDVVVNARAAYVLFTSDRRGTDRGFTAVWSSH